MNQPDLFRPDHSALADGLPPVPSAAQRDSVRHDSAPYQRHSATSLAAARRVNPPSAQMRLTVLRFIEQRGALGATDEEIQNGLTMNPSTQRPRRIELVNLGLVADSGCTRRTRSGRAATVWVMR